jgi:type VI secretion system secreted protein VgrG
MTLSDGSERVITGLISKFTQLEQAAGMTVYEAEIRPWFWFLSLTTDYRTFQNMAIPDIVKQVCKDQGFSDVQSKCVKPHSPHEYRVQYGETHLDFISRLMEEEGIFWFGEHDGKKCTMILADDNSVAKQSVKVRMATVAQETEDEFVLQVFTVRQEVRPGQYATTDYNFETPSQSLLVTAPGSHSSEVFEFPGGYGKRDDGDKLSRIRHQEIQAEAVEAEGSGRCRALKVGGKLELSKHQNKSLNAAYLLTSVKQSAKLGDFRSGGNGGVAFTSSFTAIPFDTAYRPERSTPLPRAYGYESALVVGPAGDEIHTDQFGRVKVQFFWDRKGKKDDKSSCFVRVSTVWAGKGWGAIATPRIGQEVLVAFLNGDPEDPIVVGRVYNAEQMPPYALPANKTQTGIKTRSTLGGSPDNFNEIRFEDKKGNEEFFAHAEKDMLVEVENDRASFVGHDNGEEVGHDEQIKVKNDQSLDVGANQSISVGKDRTKSVSGAETTTVGKDRTETVSGNESVTVDKNMTLRVKSSQTITVDKDVTEDVKGAYSLSISKDSAVSVQQNHGLDVKKEITIKAGDALTIDSDKEILIKAGDASIHLKKNGDIEIKGNKIQIKADSDMVLKGSKIAAN